MHRNNFAKQLQSIPLSNKTSACQIKRYIGWSTSSTCVNNDYNLFVYYRFPDGRATFLQTRIEHISTALTFPYVIGNIKIVQFR